MGFNDFLYKCWRDGFRLEREKVALANMIWQGLEVNELHMEEAKLRLADAMTDNLQDKRHFLRQFDVYLKMDKLAATSNQIQGMERYKKKSRAFMLRILILFFLIVAAVVFYLLSKSLFPLILGLGGLLGLTFIVYYQRQGLADTRLTTSGLTKKSASIEDFSKKIQIIGPEKDPPFNFDPFIPELHFVLIDRPKPQLVEEIFKANSPENNLYKIDIPKTIKATVLNAGLVNIQYKPRRREPTYLLLFDNALRNTHFLEWFIFVHRMLLKEGLQAERFSFDYDLRYCRNAQGKQIRLVDWFQDQRLIIFSTGESMIDIQKGRLFRWVNQMNDLWLQKLLLTPKGVSDWGYAEDLLKDSFFVAPGTMDGLVVGLDYLNLGNTAYKGYYEDFLAQKDRHKYLNTYDIGVLISELPERVFDWVCACALYPRLNWRMTLFLGNLLEKVPQELVNRENLTKLYQLKWFEQGKIPHQHRQLLIALLPPATLRQLREGLLAMLESCQHLVLPNSFAYDEYWQLLLRNRHELTDSENPERLLILSDLKTLIKETGTDDQELKDYVAFYSKG